MENLKHRPWWAFIISIILVSISSSFFKNIAANWNVYALVVDINENDAEESTNIKDLTLIYNEKQYIVSWNKEQSDKAKKVNNGVTLENVEVGDIIEAYYYEKNDTLSMEKYNNEKDMRLLEILLFSALIFMLIFIIKSRKYKNCN